MLLNIPSFPVTVNGNVYSSVVEIIEGGADNAEIDNTDLNYIVSATPLGYTELLSSLDIEEYSPISEDCQSYYPGTLCSTTPKEGKIRIGIIDTGLDLNGQQWIAPFVAGGGSIDGSFSFQDANGHGTSVAGIITGMALSAGLTPNELELYITKVLDANGQATLFDVIKGVQMNFNYGIQVMNVSWSYVPLEGDSESQVLCNLMSKMSSQQNFIIIAGAGNDSENIDYYDCAPANFLGINNLITVGGVQCDGSHAEGSNYSGKIVELGAPFESIICPTLNGYWIYDHSGTSFSAAIVTGAIAQVWSTYFPAGIETLDPDIALIIDLILNNATQVASLAGYVAGRRILNIEAACQAAAALSPFSGDVKRNGLSNFGVKSDHLFLDENENRALKSFMTAYPNPVQNKLYIQLEEQESSTIKIEILDMLGKRHLEENKPIGNEVSKIEINLGSKLPKGGYLLKVYLGDQVFSKIIFKE
jgi:hypothetical protein